MSVPATSATSPHGQGLAALPPKRKLAADPRSSAVWFGGNPAIRSGFSREIEAERRLPDAFVGGFLPTGLSVTAYVVACRPYQRPRH
jgi:hypothetical protein